MHSRRDLLLVSSLLILGACNDYPEYEDVGDVCVYAREVEGQDRLLVYAQVHGCSGDHKGAYVKCTVTVDGQSAHIETVYKDGKDPDDACIGPLEGSCEAVVEPGEYTLEFAGQHQPITVPGGEHVCFGIDPSTGTDAG
jgi:hypothetical protein